ncbi:hypothetical protein AVEN_31657-1, partial [Araneus ventricosus]
LLWRPLESFSLPLHFNSHLAMRHQAEELPSFMPDAKKRQLFCVCTIGQRIYIRAFVSSG